MADGAPSYPDKLEIVPLQRPPRAAVTVPGSKSITNRALVLAALTARTAPCALRGALRSEDTEVMMESLRRLARSLKAARGDVGSSAAGVELGDPTPDGDGRQRHTRQR